MLSTMKWGTVVFSFLFFLSSATISFAHPDGGFVDEFFVHPLVEGTGYNAVNTATFAVILIAAAFGVYRLLKKLRITIDRSFLMGVIPFVAMGGILRAWEDLAEASGAGRNFLLVSPLIYVTMFVIALVLLLVSVGVAGVVRTKKFSALSYHHLWFAVGVIIDLAILSQLRFANVFAFAAVLAVTAGWVVVFFVVRFLSKTTTPKLHAFLSPENMFIILVHLFDAATTFVALQYLGYGEQHVLPGFLIGVAGPWVMFALKLAVVPAVLFAFDRELKKADEQQQKTFLKLVVLILGLGPGLRNWLRMMGGF